MKRYFKKLAGLIMVLPVILILCSTPARCEHERLWVSGKVKGNLQGKVITVRLVPAKSSNYEIETSLNKYGWYAFSDAGQGKPGNFKLIVYRGDREVAKVSLKGVGVGGRAPDITLR